MAATLELDGLLSVLLGRRSILLAAAIETQSGSCLNSPRRELRVSPLARSTIFGDDCPKSTGELTWQSQDLISRRP